ncbi:phage tail tip lysozyme [Acinetobacter soli]|uniref:phage tail tip lysozyme n=1 Tax=Acinetobacter soli TaxID=487316 RepID=UPI00124FAB53|nr:phage tail tip lysozyme [Acinetobacter soli]
MDILTDDEIALGQDDPRFKPKNSRGTAADVGLGFLSGVALGTVEVATAPDALIRGDKKAAALRAQNLTVFKPEDLGTAGELTFGLTKDFTRIAWDLGLTAPIGGFAGGLAKSLAVRKAASEGLVGTTVNVGKEVAQATNTTNAIIQASLFGGQSYESEKADLLNKGADIGTARTGGAIKGASDGLGYVVPVHGVSKNLIADAVATTGLAMGTGFAGEYVEGDYLKGNQNKQVASYGEQLQENASSPLSLGANGVMALMLNVYANKAKIRPEQAQAHQAADDLTHAGQVAANVDHAEGLNPFSPETARDANAHFDALDIAQDQALRDERISLDRPVTGSAKIISAPVQNLRPISFKGKTAGTKQKIYDTVLSSGMSDADARAVLSIAHFESGGSFDPNVTNPISGFKGIGQFKPSTWRAEGGTDTNYTDLNKQIEILVKHTKNNVAYIQKETGVTLTGSQIYLPHLLGRGGAKAVIKALRDTPNARAGDVLKKIYKSDTDAVLKGNKINPDDSIQDAMGSFTKKVDQLIAKEYGGSIKQGDTAIRGSDSDFPEYESDIARIPEYKRESDVFIEANPNTFVSRLDQNDDLNLDLEQNFRRIEEPLNQEDFEYLRATAHYQPYDGNFNQVSYVEPQIDLTGSSRSAQRGLNDLETLTQDPLFMSAAGDSAPVKTVVIDNTEKPKTPLDSGTVDTAGAQLENNNEWRPTRSENYFKREMNQADGVSVQELYNKPTDTLYQRQILADGTASPVKVSKSGKDVFARLTPDQAVNEKLTTLQNKAAQALEREFWKPERANSEGAPDLLKNSEGGYGSFTTTADGREAIKVMSENPDMEVTVNRVDANGEEETITMSSRDWLDYIREQEEVAKDDIQAVKALASCALKYGSQAA